ncbi:putative benzoate 4-monooxygenase cytochrome p450 protein [Eutypa lata UCREL1]|uniref:Putative benzoate 4-monooxygenase cytochrome p450 protein n=1 Tax=Eutypa lata (strain UCR-EL1) TaxID=1287681 RepID=M7SX95_EUTLA|nr:putative benzoate 4-monooxygenase cytochrome p450 protein [Eutypa lata UCREL1]
MDLDRFLAYTAFDNVGEAIFSESFGFISSGQDVRGAIKNNLTLTPYVAVAGFYYWLYVVFVANPVITWTGIMPMGHLFDTARTALDRRKENPDARFDMVAHWLRAHQRDPKRLSIQDIEAQTMANVGAGSDTVTRYNRCPGHHLAKLQLSKIAATIVRDYSIRMVNPQSEWKWKAYFTCVPHSWPVYVERRHETS